MTLQNHVGDHEYPVRSRMRYARAIEQWRRTHPRENARRALALAGIAAVGVAVGFGVAFSLSPTGTELENPFFGGFAGFIVAVLAGSIGFARWDAGAPRRAQLAYRSGSGLPELTERQQQILALDAASDFSFGGWNSSLAFAWTWVEMPADVRRRHADGARGTSPWPWLAITPLSQLRSELDRQYRIASATDVEVLVADVVAGGPLSQRFREVLASPEAETMTSRVAAVAGTTVFDVLELGEERDGRPAELLLAGDVERAIGGVRYAYMAGHVDAERAWELLDTLAALAFARYRSYEEYWTRVAIATAFRTDSLEAVEKQRANLFGLRERGWPSASVPFPSTVSEARA